jgi:hypothetical protein
MLATVLVCLSLGQAYDNPQMAPGAADVEADVDRAMKVLAQDPPVSEVQKAAVDYFKVAQSDLSYYRTVARLRNLLPSFSAGYTYSKDGVLGYTNDRIATGEAYDPNNPQTVSSNNTVGRAYTAGASWTLQGLVFDSSMLDTYALVGINEDLVKEVTRLYYTRQHNLLAFTLQPPGDARARAALILRTREIESVLDALTGNKWSQLKQQYRGSAQANNGAGVMGVSTSATAARSTPPPSGYQPVPPPPSSGSSSVGQQRPVRR